MELSYIIFKAAAFKMLEILTFLSQILRMTFGKISIRGFLDYNVLVMAGHTHGEITLQSNHLC